MPTKYLVTATRGRGDFSRPKIEIERFEWWKRWVNRDRMFSYSADLKRLVLDTLVIRDEKRLSKLTYRDKV